MLLTSVKVFVESDRTAGGVDIQNLNQITIVVSILSDLYLA